MENSYNWRDIYPELVNKFRWGVCSTFKTPASNFPFGPGQVLATVFAQYAIDIVKVAVEAPELLSSPSAVRAFFTQERITAELDKLT